MTAVHCALRVAVVVMLLLVVVHATRNPEDEAYHPHMHPLDAPFRTIKHAHSGDDGDTVGGAGVTVLHEEFVIAWYAPILSQSGYGKEALEYVIAMDAAVEDYWNRTSHISVNPTPEGFHERQPKLKRKQSSPSSSAGHDDHTAGNAGEPMNTPPLSGGLSLTPPDEFDDFEEEQIPGTTAKLSWAKMPSYICADNHGDAFDPAVLAGYPPSARETLRHTIRRASALKHYGIAGMPRYEPADHRHANPPPIAVAVCHSEPGAWAVPHPLYDTSHCPPWSAHVAVGRTMFETDRIPAGWVGRIRYMDEVWVPTSFHVDTFTKSGVPADKLFVIPESIDVSSSMSTGWGRHRCQVGPATKKGMPATPTAPKAADESSSDDVREAAAVGAFFSSVHRTKLHQRCSFKFLSIFKWEERKGWDVLIKAFYEEFVANDDPAVRREDEEADEGRGVVCLVLKTSSYHNGVEDGDDDEYDDQISEFLSAQYGPQYRKKRRPSSPKTPASYFSNWIQIHVLNENIPASSFPLLYCGVDALVQPSRGEGWGRPHMEAMAMGVPVIATNWSGTTAFLNDENSFPVAIEKDLRKITKGSFAGHYWAEPDKNHLRSQMRKVVSLSRRHGDSDGELTLKVKLARNDVETHFNAPLIADMIMNRTRYLAHRKCEETRASAARANGINVEEVIDPALTPCGQHLPLWEERWYLPEHEDVLRTIQSGYEAQPVVAAQGGDDVANDPDSVANADTDVL